MELDDLQKWIEDLYFKIGEQKEQVEYQAHLLDELLRPWPFDCTPRSTQDSYKSKLVKQKEKEVKIEERSEFNNEMKSVEDILQKARLLHEKETNVKTKKSVENGKTKISEAQSKLSASKPIAQKTASNRKEPKRSITTVQKGQIARANKAPFKTNPNPFLGKPTRPRIKSTGTRTLTQKPTVKLKQDVASSNKNPDSASKTTKNEDIIVQNDENSTTLANVVTTPPIAKKFEEDKNFEIDLSKLDVKLNYSEFTSEIELPIKVKKLLATHSKLCDGKTFENEECKEKNDFMKKLSASCQGNDNTGEKPIRTLKAANTQLMHCIHICTNVISVLKYQNEVQPHSRSSKLRWSAQQDAYLKNETLKVVEEICSQLWRKYKFYKHTKIVNYDDHTECAEMGLLSRLRLDDLTSIHDDLNYPTSSLTYSSFKEVIKWTCEKLKHQSFLIERNLLQSVSKSYLSSLEKMIHAEKGNAPSQELANLLQNAYGLLAEFDILLPAYVKAE